MQRILQINISGTVLPIEEDAYNLLRDYISALERQFGGDDGREIIEDIENRIAELFTIRLKAGSPAIDRADVSKVIETLGAPSDLNDGSNANKQSHSRSSGSSQSYTQQGRPAGQQYQQQQSQQTYSRPAYRLLRNPYDKILGGVCGGMAVYFDVDPVIIRLLVALMFCLGVGFLVYIIAWIVIPQARSMDELYGMAGDGPVSFHDISRNMAEEMQDLKKRGEQMSRELKDFFSKKK